VCIIDLLSAAEAVASPTQLLLVSAYLMSAAFLHMFDRKEAAPVKEAVCVQVFKTRRAACGVVPIAVHEIRAQRNN